MTVSNVINDRPGAAEPTRQRILDVARRLGYTPPTRNGRHGRTGLIGVFTLDLTGQYSLEIVRGIAEEIADDQRELLLNASLDAARERERISLFAGGLVDGLLLIAPSSHRQRNKRSRPAICRSWSSIRAASTWTCPG
ncbi:LacI family DNA-binding transcriptional regulator [Streptomyces sp. DG2A-72]|uniref:LacI family DNA-binding transcriptional regulator n=1 Tax=Streptomyces sp. DG2A-72 TaxID=3051386 RepID=UPI00265C6F57|nr:LacI family DNA-binding transcriptional regulator [Streptomyces sp. DG2A-72]MDO0932256.1 LacI family DNA-binding transcriptional regulator [Streptomyces sp. DG2A-72]